MTLVSRGINAGNAVDAGRTLANYAQDAATQDANTGFQSKILNAASDEQVALTREATVNLNKQNAVNLELQRANGTGTVAINNIKMVNAAAKDGTSNH